MTIQEQVAGSGPIVTVASAATQADGTFSLALPSLPSGGVFYAEFAGDSTAGYGGTVASDLKVDAIAAPATVTFSVSPAKPVVWAGTRLTFSGKGQAKLPNGTWAPVNGAVIDASGTRHVPGPSYGRDRGLQLGFPVTFSDCEGFATLKRS